MDSEACSLQKPSPFWKCVRAKGSYNSWNMPCFFLSSSKNSAQWCECKLHVLLGWWECQWCNMPLQTQQLNSCNWQESLGQNKKHSNCFKCMKCGNNICACCPCVVAFETCLKLIQMFLQFDTIAPRWIPPNPLQDVKFGMRLVNLWFFPMWCHKFTMPSTPHWENRRVCISWLMNEWIYKFKCHFCINWFI